MAKLTLLAFDVETLGGKSWDPTQLLAIGVALHIPTGPGRPLRRVETRTWRVREMEEKPEEQKGMNPRTLAEFWSKTEAEGGGREAWDRLRKEPLSNIANFKEYVNRMCLEHPAVILLGDNPALDVPFIDFALDSAGFEPLQRKPKVGGGTAYTLVLDMHSFLFGRLKNVHDADAATGRWQVMAQELMTELALTPADFSARKSHMPAEDAAFILERFIYAHDYGKTDKLNEEYAWTVINAEDGLAEFGDAEYSEFTAFASDEQALAFNGMEGTTAEDRDVYQLVCLNVLRGKKALDAIEKKRKELAEQAAEIDRLVNESREKKHTREMKDRKRARLSPGAAVAPASRHGMD